MSTGGTVTRTIWQYSDPLPEETMAFLRGIAADYCKVKNDVYRRYSGVKNLDRLTPVYSKLYPLSRTNFLTPWTGSHISCP